LHSPVAELAQVVAAVDPDEHPQSDDPRRHEANRLELTTEDRRHDDGADEDGDESVERDRRAAVRRADAGPLLGDARPAVDGRLTRLEGLGGRPRASGLGCTAAPVDARASEVDAGLSCQGHDGLPSGGVGYY